MEDDVVEERAMHEVFAVCLDAARNGNVQAQYQLAKGYCTGRLEWQNRSSACEKDVKQGIESLQAMAKRRSVYALCLLGDYYWKGFGVERDATKAIDFWRKVIGTGVQTFKAESESDYSEEELGKLKARAQYGLAECYHYGIGVEKDLGEAVRRYCKAVSGGVEEAKEKLKELANCGSKEAQEWLVVNKAETDDFWLTRCFIALARWSENACVGIVHSVLKLILSLVRFVFGVRFWRYLMFGALAVVVTLALVVLFFWPFYLLPLLYEPLMQPLYIAFKNSNVEFDITWARLVGVLWLIVAAKGAWNGLKGEYWDKIQQKLRIADECRRQKRAVESFSKDEELK